MASLIVTGTNTFPIVPPTLASPTVKSGSRIARIDPPEGMEYPRLTKIVNQGSHVFVVWADLNSQGYGVGALYTADANATQVYQHTLVGNLSQNDLCVAAKAADDFLLLRSRNGGSEVSKWDSTGRLWVSEAFDTEGNLSWPLGISGAGSRSLVGGRTAADSDWQSRLLDGADDTVTSSHYAGVQSGSTAETGYDNSAVLSRDGDVILAKMSNPGFHAYRISTTTQTHDNTTCQSGSFDTANWPTRPGMCALSGDGAEGIVIDGNNTRAFVLTGGPASYTETTIFFPNHPRACAISNDGSTAVVLSRALDGDDGGLTVTVIDMTASPPEIATNSNGAPIRYQIHNHLGTAHGRAQFLGITDDGSEIGFGTLRNLCVGEEISHAPIFRASTSERAYQSVATYQYYENVVGGDYDTADGGQMAVALRQTSAGPTPNEGYVDLFSLS